jgi:hypothetical protein
VRDPGDAGRPGRGLRRRATRPQQRRHENRHLSVLKSHDGSFHGGHGFSAS